MIRIRLRYVDEFTDRTGTVRRYFRRPGGPRIPLPGEPGSAEFRIAYETALGGPAFAPPPSKRREPGSIGAVISSYLRSQAYLGLAPSTKVKNRSVLERLAARKHPSGKTYGEMPIARMERRHVEELLAAQSALPGAMAETLKMLRVLIGHAIVLELRTTDPTLRMRKPKGGSWRPWTDDEIARFEARWPVGTRQRLAFALHLFTGQRRSDVARMTWADVADGRVKVVQMKTGTKVDIRQHRDLAPILAASPRQHISILISEHGRAFSIASYGMWLNRAIREAGLPAECVIHGIRKTAGRKLAEAGATARQIMAVLGHKSLSEAENYTKGADQIRLADAGIDLLEGQKRNADTQTGPARLEVGSKS